jgi:hypothetical protein
MSIMFLDGASTLKYSLCRLRRRHVLVVLRFRNSRFRNSQICVDSIYGETRWGYVRLMKTSMYMVS